MLVFVFTDKRFTICNKTIQTKIVIINRGLYSDENSDNNAFNRYVLSFTLIQTILYMHYCTVVV